MKPTVGRTVLYTNLGDADGKYPPEQQAAIITKVVPVHATVRSDANSEGDFIVSLAILYPTGMFWMQDVPFSAEFARGRWTWPPRV
jgi:hypothetical protein